VSGISVTPTWSCLPLLVGPSPSGKSNSNEKENTPLRRWRTLPIQRIGRFLTTNRYQTSGPPCLGSLADDDGYKPPTLRSCAFRERCLLGPSSRIAVLRVRLQAACYSRCGKGTASLSAGYWPEWRVRRCPNRPNSTSHGLLRPGHGIPDYVVKVSTALFDAGLGRS
jgi:hypothetical protein